MNKKIIYAAIATVVIYVFYKLTYITLAKKEGNILTVRYKAGFAMGTKTFDFNGSLPGSVTVMGGYAIAPVQFGNQYLIELQDSKGIVLKQLKVNV